MNQPKNWMISHASPSSLDSILDGQPRIPRKSKRPVPHRPPKWQEVDCDDYDEIIPKKPVIKTPRCKEQSQLIFGIEKKIKYRRDDACEALLYNAGLSFYLAGEDTLKQQAFAYIPLEVISMASCFNYFMACQLFCEYILSKHRLCYEPNQSLDQLYFKIPTVIQEKISKNLVFEPSIFFEMPAPNKLRQYIGLDRTAFQHSQFFIRFARKLRSEVFNINQNTLYY